jgi:hypothetical protein
MSFNNKKTVRLPKLSKELAEFAGIMIGDGRMTKFQIIITLDKIKDKDYSKFVSSMMASLFETPASIYYLNNKSALRLVISSVDLVKYCSEILGLKIGNKLAQGLDIPDWIQCSKVYSAACVRGIYDTDGCFFLEKHYYKDKFYSYPRVNFVTGSPKLSKSIYRILFNLKLEPRIRRDGIAIQLENKAKICNYFRTVGTHNPKHWNKFIRFFQEYNGGVPEWFNGTVLKTVASEMGP